MMTIPTKMIRRSRSLLSASSVALPPSSISRFGKNLIMIRMMIMMMIIQMMTMTITLTTIEKVSSPAATLTSIYNWAGLNFSSTITRLATINYHKVAHNCYQVTKYEHKCVTHCRYVDPRPENSKVSDKSFLKMVNTWDRDVEHRRNV